MKIDSSNPHNCHWLYWSSLIIIGKSWKRLTRKMTSSIVFCLEDRQERKLIIVMHILFIFDWEMCSFCHYFDSGLWNLPFCNNFALGLPFSSSSNFEFRPWPYVKSCSGGLMNRKVKYSIILYCCCSWDVK